MRAAIRVRNKGLENSELKLKFKCEECKYMVLAKKHQIKGHKAISL